MQHYTFEQLDRLQVILFSGSSKQFWDELVQFVPELEKNFNCPQSPKWHPEGPVHVHICQVIDNVAEYRDINMSMTALFHDVGKAWVHKVVDKVDEDGVPYKKISHAGHEFESAKIAERHRDLIEAIGANYDAVYEMVYNHMKAHSYLDGNLKRKVKREAFELLPQFERIMKFQKADSDAKRIET